ncbi:alpha/beta hydrolase [Pseudonocardia sp. NPDC049154]|uniref:alpha/beta fold hydrolase n=1 Tax=Pseudonocardia sp. NPDC049154 TaxID=3155501 RepID=UPI00340DECA2
MSAASRAPGRTAPVPSDEYETIRRRHNVVVTGRRDGPVVVLAHGFGCDQNMWRFVLDDLAARCTVVLFDHVGAGRSDLSAWSAERYGSLDAYASDVVNLCRALDLGEVVYVGHSVSASVGVLAAIRAPELFAGLALLTPSPHYLEDGDYHGGFTADDIEELLTALDSNYLGWSATMAPVIMGAPGQPELARELSDSFCRADPQVAAVFARATFLADNRSDLAKVTTPSLVVQSAQDSIAPPEVGRYVHRQMAGSRLVVLDTTGHCPHMSSPEVTARALLDFVFSDLVAVA